MWGVTHNAQPLCAFSMPPIAGIESSTRTACVTYELQFGFDWVTSFLGQRVVGVRSTARKWTEGVRTMTPSSVRGRFRRSEQQARGRREAPLPSSLVRVLHDGDELEAARQRAIESERLVIEAVKARISHYEESSRRAVVIQIPDAIAGPTVPPEARSDTA